MKQIKPTFLEGKSPTLKTAALIWMHESNNENVLLQLLLDKGLTFALIKCAGVTTQKTKFSIKDFFSMSADLVKFTEKSLTENFIFCAGVK